MLVDRTEKILPASADPHVSFIDAPGARPTPLIPVNSLLDLRGVALDPAKDRGRVDRDASLLHHLSQVTVADPVLAVPPDAQQDNLDWKAATLEQRQQEGSSIGRPSLFRQG
jgi:hypothetical protein